VRATGFASAKYLEVMVGKAHPTNSAGRALMIKTSAR